MILAPAALPTKKKSSRHNYISKKYNIGMHLVGVIRNKNLVFCYLKLHFILKGHLTYKLFPAEAFFSV